MYRCSVVILASKKYATLNISELEFLDFPGILRQNGKTQRLFSDLECQIWWLLLDARTTVNNVSSQDDKKLSLQFDNQMISWIKIITWHTFQNPYMKFPDISLTFAPFQNFPDIFSNSLTIPWPWKNIFFPDVWQPCDSLLYQAFVTSSRKFNILKKLNLPWKFSTYSILRRNIQGNWNIGP